MACALAAALMGVAAPAQAGDRGDVVALASGQCAQDINNHGVVVTDHGLVRNGRLQALPGGLERGHGINDVGQVAGEIGGVAALWDGRRTVVLGVADPAHSYSEPTAMNARGDVVGVSGAFGEPSQAFRWSRGVMTVLPGTGATAAQGVNDRGDVVGYVTDPDGRQRAVRWGRDGTRTYLSTLGGAHSQATSVNNAGIATGYSYTPDGRMHAVRWDQSGVITDLTTTTTFGIASDANVRGVVVGHVSTDAGQQGFVRGRDRVTRPLPVLTPGAAAVLESVNDRGWAVGCELFGDDESLAILYRP